MEASIEERLRSQAATLPALPLGSSDVWRAIKLRRAVRVRRRAIGGGVAAALAAGVTIVSPWSDGTPNASQMPGATPSSSCDRTCLTGGQDEEMLRSQDYVLEFTARIHEFADGNEDFGALAIGTDPLLIEITWYGAVPPEVSEVLDEAEAAGILVERVSAPYRLSELEEATSALHQALDEHGIRVLSVGPASGMKGVAIASTDLVEDVSAQEEVRDLASRVIGGIPVTFMPGTVPSGDLSFTVDPG